MTSLTKERLAHLVQLLGQLETDLQCPSGNSDAPKASAELEEAVHPIRLHSIDEALQSTSFDAQELSLLRDQSLGKLKTTWESIIRRYSDIQESTQGFGSNLPSKRVPSSAPSMEFLPGNELPSLRANVMAGKGQFDGIHEVMRLSRALSSIASRETRVVGSKDDVWQSFESHEAALFPQDAAEDDEDDVIDFGSAKWEDALRDESTQDAYPEEQHNLTRTPSVSRALPSSVGRRRKCRWAPRARRQMKLTANALSSLEDRQESLQRYSDSVSIITLSSDSADDACSSSSSCSSPGSSSCDSGPLVRGNSHAFSEASAWDEDKSQLVEMIRERLRQQRMCARPSSRSPTPNAQVSTSVKGRISDPRRPKEASISKDRQRYPSHLESYPPSPRSETHFSLASPRLRTHDTISPRSPFWREHRNAASPPLTPPASIEATPPPTLAGSLSSSKDDRPSRHTMGSGRDKRTPDDQDDNAHVQEKLTTSKRPRYDHDTCWSTHAIGSSPNRKNRSRQSIDQHYRSSKVRRPASSLGKDRDVNAVTRKGSKRSAVRMTESSCQGEGRCAKSLCMMCGGISSNRQHS